MKSTHPGHQGMHTPDLLSALHHNACIVTRSTDIIDAHSKHMGLLQNQQETILIKSWHKLTTPVGKDCHRCVDFACTWSHNQESSLTVRLSKY